MPDFRATGVRDGKRAYDWPCIIRCISTVDVMTAEVPELDWALLKRITARITAEVPNICRVCCDLTPKPVGTVEWEQADRALTCTSEYRIVPLSFVSYGSHGKATSDIGE